MPLTGLGLAHPLLLLLSLPGSLPFFDYNRIITIMPIAYAYLTRLSDDMTTFHHILDSLSKSMLLTRYTVSYRRANTTYPYHGSLYDTYICHRAVFNQVLRLRSHLHLWWQYTIPIAD
jgi:hypothetical protein